MPFLSFPLMEKKQKIKASFAFLDFQKIISLTKPKPFLRRLGAKASLVGFYSQAIAHIIFENTTEFKRGQ